VISGEKGWHHNCALTDSLSKVDCYRVVMGEITGGDSKLHKTGTTNSTTGLTRNMLFLCGDMGQLAWAVQCAAHALEAPLVKLRPKNETTKALG